MSVTECTPEIGVLNALGWGGMRVLGMLFQEAAWKGLLEAVLGIGVVLFFTQQLSWIPIVDLPMVPLRELNTFVRATVIALALGFSADIYPVFRVTTLQTTESLRYE